jgi:hypothetical protein
MVFQRVYAQTERLLSPQSAHYNVIPLLIPYLHLRSLNPSACLSALRKSHQSNALDPKTPNAFRSVSM